MSTPEERIYGVIRKGTSQQTGKQTNIPSTTDIKQLEFTAEQFDISDLNKAIKKLEEISNQAAERAKKISKVLEEFNKKLQETLK